jgi:hypothetical protein
MTWPGVDAGALAITAAGAATIAAAAAPATNTEVRKFRVVSISI